MAEPLLVLLRMELLIKIKPSTDTPTVKSDVTFEHYRPGILM
jgi:hypothetical protein